jgi:hypothetical protein
MTERTRRLLRKVWWGLIVFSIVFWLWSVAWLFADASSYWWVFLLSMAAYLAIIAYCRRMLHHLEPDGKYGRLVVDPDS